MKLEYTVEYFLDPVYESLVVNGRSNPKSLLLPCGGYSAGDITYSSNPSRFGRTIGYRVYRRESIFLDGSLFRVYGRILRRGKAFEKFSTNYSLPSYRRDLIRLGMHTPLSTKKDFEKSMLPSGSIEFDFGSYHEFAVFASSEVFAYILKRFWGKDFMESLTSLLAERIDSAS